MNVIVPFLYSCVGFTLCHLTKEFTCSDNGGCVSRDVECDGKRDCEDNSDEIQCGGY